MFTSDEHRLPPAFREDKPCDTFVITKTMGTKMSDCAAMPFSLAGRRVLITGASGGIGSETARVCAALSAELILTDLQVPQTLCESLRSDGHRVHAYALDVRDRVATQHLIEHIGTPDAVIANAGLCPWDDWLSEDWDKVFDEVIDVNLRSVLHLSRCLMPGMIQRGSGKIVVISSVAGRIGGLRASPHYVAAKAGVSGVVKWLARRAGSHGVNVNAICPGAVDTAMTATQTFDLQSIPMGRLATAHEIALPAAFLCGAGSNYMSGATLDVNGGVYMN